MQLEMYHPGTHDDAGQEMVRAAGSSGEPDSVAEQMQRVFHELHAAGRNPLCPVCDGQYGSA
jgi:hypothetical protein